MNAALALALALVVTLASPLHAAITPATPAPTPTPDQTLAETERERASFQVLDGFDIQLFASEQQGAVKPIAIRFDARGRLWVVGSTVYPQLRPGETANDKITILEDTDGDGRADRSTVFADGLLIPLGMELGDQGAYVASATELLHFRDRDGDGRADERRVVLRGFGTGDAHQTINSFAWGPSGELMISQGLHAQSRVETPWGLAELRQAGLFRLWPRRLKLEPIWSGAMGAHNPYGTAFDRWGQPFVFAGNGHGIYHLTPALIPTDHFLLHPALWQQGRKFGGADFVENPHWPEAHQGEVITGGYLQNTVERFRLTDHASTFRVQHLPPLVQSTNTAFRIVDVRFGPDGALYLCDWHNTLIGHYQTSLRDPGRDRSRGRIWRVTARNRPTPSPATPNPSLDSLDTPSLLHELTSPHRWSRLTAKRVLADRPTPEVVPALHQWLRNLPNPSPHTLFEALGVLASHETVDTNLLARLATAPEPGARAYAARLVGHWATRIPNPLDWLHPLVDDPHPRVRLEAVVACAHVPLPRAVECAARATDHPMDHHLDYAFTQTVHALKPHWREAQRQGRLSFDNNPRRAAAFARADGTGDTAADAASRLARVSEVALDRDAIDRLARIVATSGEPRDLPVLLRPRTFTLGDLHLPDLHAEILDLLHNRSLHHPVLPTGNLESALAPFLQHPHPHLRQTAVRLAGTWQILPLRDPIAQLATNPDNPQELRSAAISALGAYARTEDRDTLLSLARSANPHALQPVAIRALVRFAPDTAAQAAAAWLSSPDNPSINPASADATVAAFLARKDGPEALAASLNLQPPPPARAAWIAATLAASGRQHPALATVVDRVLHPTSHSPATLADIPDLARAVRTAGQPDAGRDIFHRPELACVNCHAVDGTTDRIGPNLGALGTSQSIEFILGAILDPQKEVKEGFNAVEIETRTGDVHQGYPRGESEETVALHDHLANTVVTLRRDAISSRRDIGSLMPPGLANSLSRDELRDLTAYLARLGRRD